MKINGIDFTTIDNFREKVTVKLSEKQSVELPLILGRDAPIADYFINKVNFIATKYAMLYNKANALEDEASNIDDKDDEAVVAAITAQTEAGDKWLDARYDLDKKMAEIVSDILKFITPYLKDIKLEGGGGTLVDFLAVREPKCTIQVLRCMYLGQDALKEPETEDEENPEDSKNVKQG